VKTVQILLTAGSVTAGPEMLNPMDILLTIVFKISDRLLSPSCIFLVFHENMYILINEVIELLLKYGAQRSHSSLKQSASTILVILTAERLVKMYDTVVYIPANLNPLHDIMDSLGGIYRLFVLAESGASMTDDDTNSFFHRAAFRNAFLAISRYSSQSGNSKKLIQLLLCTLSTSALNGLRCWCLRRLEDLSKKEMSGQTTEAKRRYVNNALEWVRGVLIPFSLQRLSRDVITRAMLHRCLRAQDTASLCIPVQLEQYLALNTC